MATVNDVQATGLPLELLSRAIPSATNDEMLELAYRVLENLAERAVRAADLAIDSDNRDFENEALVFVTEVDNLVHWPYHGRFEFGWTIHDAKKDLEVATRNRRERLNGQTTAIEQFSHRRRSQEQMRQQADRVREEAKARVTRKRAKVTPDRVLRALAKAVASRGGAVRVADVIVALDSRLVDTSVPGRQLVVSDVSRVLRELAAGGRIALRASGPTTTTTVGAGSLIATRCRRSMMPAEQAGSVYTTSTGFGIRWIDETGQRRRQAGFSSPSKARAWFRDVELPRMRGGLINEPLTLREFSDRYVARYEADRSPVTVATLKARLVRALAEFGDVNVGDLRTGEIAAWEATLPPRFRYAVVRALRQVLDAAVAWEYLARNPAKATGKNVRLVVVERIALEPSDVDKLAGEMRTPYDAALVVGAWCYLRPSELLAARAGRRRRKRVAHQAHARRTGRDEGER